MKVVYCIDGITDYNKEFLEVSLYSLRKNTDLEPVILTPNKSDYDNLKDIIYKYNVEIKYQHSYIYNYLIMKYKRENIINILEGTQKRDLNYFFNNAVFLKMEAPKYFPNEDFIIIVDPDTIFTPNFDYNELKNVNYIGVSREYIDEKVKNINAGFIFYNINNCSLIIDNIIQKSIDLISENINTSSYKKLYYSDFLEETTIKDAYLDKLTYVNYKYNFRPNIEIPINMEVCMFHFQGDCKSVDSKDLYPLTYKNSELYRKYRDSIRKNEIVFIKEDNVDYNFISNEIYNTLIEDMYIPPKCKNPEISVIVRVHKEPNEWLIECVNTILSQSFNNFEIIIVFDGNYNIYSNFDDNRVGYLRLSKNRGAAQARNEGIKRTRGKYIRLIDVDDKMPDNTLELQLSSLKKNKNARISFGKLIPFGEKWDKDSKWQQYDYFKSIWDGQNKSLRDLLLTESNTIVPGPSPMWEKKWAEGYFLPDDYDWGEDAAWYKGLLIRDDNKDSAVWVDEPVLMYNVREDSMTDFSNKPVAQIKHEIMNYKTSRITDYKNFINLSIKYKNKPIKLAIIDKHGLVAGGAQWYVMQIVANLDPNIIQPKIFVGQSNPTSELYMAQRSIEVKSFYENYEKNLEREIKEWKPDIVNSIWDVSSLTNNIRRNSKICFAYVHNRFPHYSGINDYYSNNIDNLICISNEIYDTCNKHNQFNLDKKNKYVIYPPVDTSLIRKNIINKNLIRRNYGIKDDEILVSWSGRITDPMKRFDIFKQIIYKYNKKVRFIIFGHIGRDLEKYEEYKKEFDLFSKEFNIILLDNLYPWQSSLLSSIADIYVSTSELEGISMSMLESMAGGAFPIVTDCGGVKEAVHHDISGFICENQNTNQIISRFDEAISIGKLELNKRASINMDFIRAKFDVKESARQHTLMYYRSLYE